MEIDGKELNDAAVAEAMRELMAHDGPTPTLTVNILRHWSPEKIQRFARRLIEEQHSTNGKDEAR